MSSLKHRHWISVVALCLMPRLMAFGQAPDSLSFQGYVTDPGGVPINDPAAVMTFKLYKGGSQIWSETQGVEVVNGGFNALLGAITPLDTVKFNQPIELGITFGVEPEITPRTPLTTVAYARGLPGLYTFYHERAGGDMASFTLVGGAANNQVGPNAVGATIGGGGGKVDGVERPNQVVQDFGTVGGGAGNEAGFNSTVGGGIRNVASSHGTVSGGGFNEATGGSSTVGGGANNVAGGVLSTVSGGGQNETASDYAAVGGGYFNEAAGQSSTVSGGNYNASSAPYATVGGGINNSANANAVFVGGGDGNVAYGAGAAIGGGDSNTTRGDYSTVPGGRLNAARGDYSFAAGFVARPQHEGSFVWGDHSVANSQDSLATTGPNQFLIRATGGVGIGTNDPGGALHVVGDDPSGSFDGQFIIAGNEETGDVGTGGGIVFEGHDGNIPRTWAWIRALKENSTDGNTASYLGFATRTGGGTMAERARINSSGDFVPAANNAYQLGNASFQWQGLWAVDTSINTSDRRAKRDVADIGYGLRAIEALRPVSYRWKDRPEAGVRLGLVAQEVLDVVPEVVAVPDDPDELLGMRYAELVPVLIKAIQEQQQQIDELRSALDAAMGSTR